MKYPTLPETEALSRGGGCPPEEAGGQASPARPARGSGDLPRAGRDPVTGLADRERFQFAVRELLNARPDTSFSMIRLDLDNFKFFNDLFGLQRGDRLLCYIASALKRAVPPTAVVGRIQADHFAVCIPSAELRLPDSFDSARQWLRSFSPEFDFNLRIGVYPVEDPSMEVGLMLDRALLALRSIKGSYSRHAAYYDPSMRQAVLDNIELLGQFHQALEEKQFELWFQPQYDLTSKRVVGAEALVRWRHPEKGLLLPGAFIPLLEKNGSIARLDQYMLEQACIRQRSFLDAGYQTVPLWVNVSRQGTCDPGRVQYLSNLLDRYRLDRSLIRLEITETAYISNPDQISAMVSALRGDGFMVAMDDFGSGCSSLNMLKDVPVDLLKLDMRFLNTDGRAGGRGGIILNAVIRMAHWLNIPVLAEGVETVLQADFLKTIGCGMAQGFLFSKPLPQEEYLLLLQGRETLPFPADVVMSHFFDNEAFWDPSAQAAIVFSSFVGAAGVFECRGKELLPLRLNDRFFAELQTTRERFDSLASPVGALAPECETEFWSMIQAVHGSSAPAGCESRWLHPGTGQWLWLEIHAREIAHSADRFAVYVTVENITQRKIMEEELRLSEEESRLAMEQTGRMVCRYDIPSRSLSVPPAYAKAMHIPQCVSNIPDCAPSVYPADIPAYKGFYASIAGGEKTGSATVRFYQGEHRLSWMELRFTTIFSAGGAPLRAIVSAEDVSAKQLGRIDSERNRLLMERTGTCLFDYDVVFDVMTMEAAASDGKLKKCTVPRYLTYLAQTPRVAPQSRTAIQGMIRDASAAPGKGSLDIQADIWGTGLRQCRMHYVSISDGSALVYRIAGQLDDVQDERDRMDLLRRLSGAPPRESPAGGSERTITERIFRLLYAAEDMDESIRSVLEIVGRYYCVSRVYIAEDSSDHRRYATPYAWSAPGVAVQQGSLSGAAYAFDENGSNVHHACFNEYGVFLCPDVSALSQDRRKHLSRPGVCSMLQCAILNDGDFWGYVGFDECTQKRSWTEGQVNTLVLIAEILGVFVIKRRLAMRAVRPDYSSIVELLPGGVVTYTRSGDERQVFVNQAFARLAGCSRQEATRRLEGDVRAFVDPGDYPVWEAFCRRLADPAVTADQVDLRLQTSPDGPCRQVRCLTSVISWDSDGYSLFSTVIDVSKQKEAEDALRIRSEEYAVVVRQSGKRVLTYDLQSGTLRRSHDFRVEYGFPPEEAEAPDQPEKLVRQGFVAAESAGEYLAFFQTLRNGTPQASVNCRVRMGDGGYRWTHADATLVNGPLGKPDRAVISIYDNTSQMEKEMAYQKWQRDLALTLTESALYLEVNLSLDAVQRVETPNNHHSITVPESLSGFVVMGAASGTYAEDVPAFTEFFSRQRLMMLYSLGVFEDRLEYRVVTEAGPCWYRAAVQMIRIPYTDEVLAFIVFTDIDRRRRELEQLSEQARKDSLTGLLNHDATVRSITQRLMCMENRDRCTLFMLDLDNFKQINDRFGHQRGDETLVRAARVLSDAFRSGDIVGRIGGDEFMAFFESPEISLSVKRAQALVEKLRFPIGRDGNDALSVSVGAVVVEGRHAFDELYRTADQALYAAKRAGKNRYHIQQPVSLSGGSGD